MTRLNEMYTKSIRPDLLQQLGYKNLLEVPKLQKIVINTGLGEAVQDSKKVASAVADLAKITGQKRSEVTSGHSERFGPFFIISSFF